MLTDDQLLNHLRQKLDNYRNHRHKNYDEKFIEAYRLYKTYRDHKLHLWQTNIFLPYVFSMIETVLPRVVMYLWQGDTLVKAHPRGFEDIPDAEVVDNLMQWQIDTQIPNMFLESVEFLKSCLIHGTGLAKLTWNVYKDHPEFINLDVFDFYPQPFKKYISEMDGLFHIFDMPLDMLQRRMRFNQGYQNIDKLRNTSMTSIDESSKKERDAEVGKIQNYETGRAMCLIYQYWGKLPVQETIYVNSPGLSYDTEKEFLVEIGNRNHIIRRVPNPYINGIKPFIAAKDYIDLNEFYGIGEITPIKDLQIEGNELENNIMDDLKIRINQMWKVSTTAGIDLANLMSYPGNVILADDINGIQELRHSDIPTSAFKQQENIPQQIGNAAGVHDYSKGANAPGMTDTVGGINSLIEEANQRFAFKIKILQMSAIKEIATTLFILDKQFIKGIEIPVRLEGGRGQRWMMIQPDNLKGMYDFKPVSVALVGNRLAKQNTMLRLLEVLAKAPPIPSVIEGMLEQFEIPNKEQVMDDLYRLWGIPRPGEGQGMPMSGGGAPSSPSQAVPMPPPEMSEAQAQQNMARLIAGGMR